MAWLEDLAKAARITSLGKLAKAAIEHEDWPAGETDNYRSVENLLRFVDQKMKKGQVWLDNRPAVKEVLADLLGVSPESLDPGSVEPDGPADPRVELKELRDARPIDLRKEDLFPGIPREVFSPDSWELSWWFAQAGSGKTVVGRWLEARHAAAFVRGDRWSDVVPRIPPEGAVYIELSVPDSTDAVRFPADLARRNICVAAPFLPVPPELARGMRPRRESLFAVAPRQKQSRFSGFFWPEEEPEEPMADTTSWRRIDTDPKEEWIERLIRWVGERMRSGGGFDVDGALEVVRRRLFETSLSTPGDYIGVCGVIEKIGAKRLLAEADIDRVVGAFLESRMERTDLTGRSAWTAPALWRLICGCVEGSLVHWGGHGTFPSEVALKSWLPEASLPPGDDSVLQRIIDDPDIGPQDLASIRSKARPSRDGALRELFRLHLLEPCGEGMIALRPSWLGPLARQAALDHLVEFPDRGLGEVLLQPALASWMLPRLRDCFKLGGAENGSKSRAKAGERGWELARWAMERVSMQDPATVAALEACFQAAGVALLDPLATAPIADLHRLWLAQMSVSLHAYSQGPPRPRLLRVEGAEPGWEQAWEIACLAISERLHVAGVELEPPAVAPWGAKSWPEYAERLAWGLERACILVSGTNSERRVEPPDFVTDAWRLGGRLYRTIGPLASRHGATAFFAPFELLDAIKAGTTPVSGGRFNHEYQLDVLAQLADEVGLGVDQVLAELWRVKGDGDAVFGSDFLERLSPEWRRRIWESLPPEVLSTRLRPWIGQEKRLGWSDLLPAHWDVVLDAWRDDVGHMRPGLAHIPEHHARRLIRERLFGHDTDRGPRALWERFPDLCVEESVRQLVTAEVWASPSGNVLWRAPPGAVVRIVDLVRPHLDAIRGHEPARHQITQWAHQLCALRGEHWRAAWGLLAEVDPRNT